MGLTFAEGLGKVISGTMNGGGSNYWRVRAQVWGAQDQQLWPTVDHGRHMQMEHVLLLSHQESIWHGTESVHLKD